VVAYVGSSVEDLCMLFSTFPLSFRTTTMASVLTNPLRQTYRYLVGDNGLFQNKILTNLVPTLSNAKHMKTPSYSIRSLWEQLGQ
jgi:hypothetical protein